MVEGLDWVCILISQSAWGTWLADLFCGEGRGAVYNELRKEAQAGRAHGGLCQVTGSISDKGWTMG